MAIREMEDLVQKDLERAVEMMALSAPAAVDSLPAGQLTLPASFSGH